MKIGKYELPIYFNREFLKFNPFLFLIKEYDHIIFWVAMPIIGLALKFFGGLLDWGGSHGMSTGGGVVVDSILNFMRSKTWFDSAFDNFLIMITHGVFGVEKGSGVEFFVSYVFFSFLWFVKFFTIYYCLAKISLIFFSSKEDLTFDGVVKNKTTQYGTKNTKEEINKIANDTWNLIQLLKRC